MLAIRAVLGGLLAAAAVTAAGCSDAGGGGRAELPSDAPDVVTVSSAAFADGQSIPEKYTCDGVAVSPPLAWSGVAAAARGIALVVDDPDAPGGNYVHWLVVNVDPLARRVDEGAVPAGGTQVVNSSGAAGYAGPCPPSGVHHYRFTVYDLSRRVDVTAGSDVDAVFAAIESAAVGQGTLIGTYAHR
jgi:Raf kinase inhibitor-like YbhB/YbcL family protein